MYHCGQMAAVARQCRLQAVISRITPPVLPEYFGYKTTVLFLFLPPAAVSRTFAAVLRVIPR